MWAQILGTMLGAMLGWAAIVYVLFYFLGFPPVGEVIDQIIYTRYIWSQ